MPTQSVAGDEERIPAGSEDSLILRLFPSREIPDEKIPSVTGLVIGHFEIQERIGRGGMGSVFRAIDQRLDREVALKVLSPRQLNEVGAVQRFQNEARAAAKLDHENIARVYYIGQDQGIYFIAFEYVHGVTVRELILRHQRLTIDEAVNFTLQTAEALTHTAACGLVHRDIKPSNLIVTPSGRVKLVDLGLVRSTDPDADDDLTVTGTTLGTFDYISPEQARDPKNVDVRSDIYSLGCTLYHMVTGKPPYPDGTSIDKLVQHSSGQTPDPTVLNPRVAPRLSLAIQQMMALNCDERFPSPDAVIDELSLIAEGLGLKASAPVGTIWQKPMYGAGYDWWEENRNWILAFAALIAIAVGADRFHALYLSVFEGTSEPAVAFGAAENVRSSSPLASEYEVEDSAPSDRTNVEVGTTVDGTFESRDIALNDQNTTESVLRTQASSAIIVGSTGRLTPDAEADRRPESPSKSVGFNEAIPRDQIRQLTQDIIELVSSRANASSLGSDVSPARMDDVAISPFLIEGTGETFQSLESACVSAETDSVILVDHDGPLDISQKPILIQDKRLTIRPVEGKRPLLVFRPAAEFVASPRFNAITVSEGSLAIYNMDIRLEAADNPFADHRAVFSLDRAKRLQLEGVTVTLSNPSRRPASFIERLALDTAPGRMMPQSEMKQVCEVTLEDCLFRGDGDLILDQSLTPAMYRLKQVAGAFGGSAFLIQGADPVEIENMPASGAMIECELNHVTALTESSFLHIDTGEYRECPLVNVRCRSSLLEVTGSAQPMIRLDGFLDLSDLLSRFRWNGESNLLAGPDSESAVELNSELLSALDGTEAYSFSGWWKQQWESADEIYREESVLGWNPLNSKKLTEFQPTDLSLTEASLEPRAPDNFSRGFNFNPERSALPETIPVNRSAAEVSSAADSPVIFGTW